MPGPPQIVLSWLVAAVFCCASAFAQSPQIVLTWGIANSGYDVGSTRPEMRDGWPKFIDDYVEPGVEWARESNVEPAILLQNPFGLYCTDAVPNDNDPSNDADDDDGFHIDGYDYAKAMGSTWLTNDFATSRGWKRASLANVQKYAYLGGVYLTPRLRNMPPADLAALIKRNLKPLKDAGFRGVYIDYAENAITHPFYSVYSPSTQSMGRSTDQMVLAIADSMFTTPSGIEASPRAFPEFSLLWPRNCYALDSTWRHRYGGFTPEQIAYFGYGTRHADHVGLGYDRSVLTGNVWRGLDYADDPTKTGEAAALIITEGDLPVFNPYPFIQNDVPASEVLP